MRVGLTLVLAVVVLGVSLRADGDRSPFAVLKPESFGRYVDAFNADDVEDVVNHVPNAGAWAWMRQNVPLFECPEPEFERVYYYRWWTYRKHLKRTPAGFVLTEF